jgi:hypothetical protein
MNRRVGSSFTNTALGSGSDVKLWLDEQASGIIINRERPDDWWKEVTRNYQWPRVWDKRLRKRFSLSVLGEPQAGRHFVNWFLDCTNVSGVPKTGKPQLTAKKSGVHKIPCSCGEVYISQPRRYISTMISEHIRDIRNAKKRPAVAEHSAEKKYSTDFDTQQSSLPIFRRRVPASSRGHRNSKTSPEL